MRPSWTPRTHPFECVPPSTVECFSWFPRTAELRSLRGTKADTVYRLGDFGRAWVLMECDAGKTSRCHLKTGPHSSRFQEGVKFLREGNKMNWKILFFFWLIASVLLYFRVWLYRIWWHISHMEEDFVNEFLAFKHTVLLWKKATCLQAIQHKNKLSFRKTVKMVKTEPGNDFLHRKKVTGCKILD